MQLYSPNNYSMPPTNFGYVIAPCIEATHNFKNAPALNILFVSSRLGVVTLDQNNNTRVADFVKMRLASLKYLVSVSFGVATLANASVLNSKKATTNKSR